MTQTTSICTWPPLDTFCLRLKQDGGKSCCYLEEGVDTGPGTKELPRLAAQDLET